MSDRISKHYKSYPDSPIVFSRSFLDSNQISLQQGNIQDLDSDSVDPLLLPIVEQSEKKSEYPKESSQIVSNNEKVYSDSQG